MMIAGPPLLIVAIIALIIYAIYTFVDSMNEAAGTSISATGIIFGAFAVLGAFIWNLFLGVLELVLGVINYLVNPFINFANFLANVFQNPISSVIYLFQGMADTVLALLQKVASALDFVFGSKMADAVGGWRAGLKDMADAAVAAHAPNENYEKRINELNLSAEGFGLERISYTDAWDAGYSAGENLESKFSGLDDMLNPSGLGGLDGMASFAGFEGIDKIGSVGEVGKIKENVNLADEDIKMMQDLAERRYVANVNMRTIEPSATIHVTNNNGEPLDENTIARAVKGVLDEQVEMHTDTTYED